MVMGCEAGVQMTPQNIVTSNLYLCCAGMYPVSRPGDRRRAAAECDKCGCSVVVTRGPLTSGARRSYFYCPRLQCVWRDQVPLIVLDTGRWWTPVSRLSIVLLPPPPLLYIPGQCLVTPSMVEWRPGVPSLGPLQCPAILHLL